MKPEDIRIGKEVIYWSVIKNDGTRLDPKKTEIASEVSTLADGTDVCKVKGISGVVSVDHLDEITAGSLFAAKMKGLDVDGEEIEKESEKFFSDRGVSTEVNYSGS